MTSATRTWTFLTLLMISIVVSGQVLAGREGLLWGVALALTINAMVYLYQDLRLKLFFSGQLVEGKDPWGISEMVQTLSKRARIPLPQVKILNKQAPQAMALGRSPKSAQILLTQGLIDLLEPEELNAIIAYQIAIIKRQDIVGLTVAAAFLDFALSLCRFLDSGFRVLLGAQKKQDSFQANIFSSLFSPLISLFLHLEVGGSSYEKADAFASELISNPQSLAKALWKLHSYSLTVPLDAPLATSHLWIVSPLHKKDWTAKFEVQPKIERRIRNLVGYYPI